MLKALQPMMYARLADIFHELERDSFLLWQETGRQYWYDQWARSQQQLVTITRQWIDHGQPAS